MLWTILFLLLTFIASIFTNIISTWIEPNLKRYKVAITITFVSCGLFAGLFFDKEGIKLPWQTNNLTNEKDTLQTNSNQSDYHNPVKNKDTNANEIPKNLSDKLDSISRYLYLLSQQKEFSKNKRDSFASTAQTFKNASVSFKSNLTDNTNLKANSINKDRDFQNWLTSNVWNLTERDGNYYFGEGDYKFLDNGTFISLKNSNNKYYYWSFKDNILTLSHPYDDYDYSSIIKTPFPTLIEVSVYVYDKDMPYGTTITFSKVNKK